MAAGATLLYKGFVCPRCSEPNRDHLASSEVGGLAVAPSGLKMGWSVRNKKAHRKDGLANLPRSASAALALVILWAQHAIQRNAPLDLEIMPNPEVVTHARARGSTTGGGWIRQTAGWSHGHNGQAMLAIRDQGFCCRRVQGGTLG